MNKSEVSRVREKEKEFIENAEKILNEKYLPDLWENYKLSLTKISECYSKNGKSLREASECAGNVKK